MKNEKAKHTPGPWVIYAGNEGKPVIHSPEYEKNAGGGIIGIAVLQTVGEESQRQANAALIAAAPELMNACQMAVNEMPGNEQGQKIASMLRAAIAKAEGK